MNTRLNEVLAEAIEQRDKLCAEVTKLKRELIRDKDCHQADMKMLVERTQERDVALLQIHEEREWCAKLLEHKADEYKADEATAGGGEYGFLVQAGSLLRALAQKIREGFTEKRISE
jgi:hypothetical protein